MSSTITPNIQMQFAPVANSSIQEQYLPIRSHSVKMMESPYSSGGTGFCLSLFLFMILEGAMKAANHAKNLDIIAFPASILAGIGAGLLQKKKIDTVKADPNLNQDIIIKNHFTGSEKVIKKRSGLYSTDNMSPISSASSPVVTRRFENPLSRGVIGTIIGAGVFGLSSLFWRNQKKDAASGLSVAVSSLGLGILFALMEKLRIDGAKSNKDVNQNIIIENSLTGSKKVIKNRSYAA